MASDLHADPGIVGQVVKIGGTPHTVIGVMPGSFHFPEGMGPDLAKGRVVAGAAHGRDVEASEAIISSTWWADLRPGVSIMQAQQELDAIAAHIPRNR